MDAGIVDLVEGVVQGLSLMMDKRIVEGIHLQVEVDTITLIEDIMVEVEEVVGVVVWEGAVTVGKIDYMDHHMQ